MGSTIGKWQSYNDLDIYVNSGSTRLERLSSKPNNIGRQRIFNFPEHYRKYVMEKIGKDQ